jgi:DNA-binding PadR family transcriptional regulator
MPSESESNTSLPLTEATFFILLSLSSGPKHGYAIMKGVNLMSKGRINFSTGTLYGALKRLLEQGWIVRNGENEGDSDETTRTRKEYALTALGKSMLNSEVTRMQALVHLAVSSTTKDL